MTPHIFSSALFALLLAPALSAQDDPLRIDSIQRQLQGVQDDSTQMQRLFAGGPVGQRLHVDYGLSLRMLVLQFEDDRDHTRTLRSSAANLYLRADLDENHRAFARLRFQRDNWKRGDSLDGRGDESAEPIIDRAWYEYTWRGADSPMQVQSRLGRQFVEWGGGLSLSNSLDAASVTLHGGAWSLQALVGMTVHDDVVDWDGARTDYDRDTQRLYAGGLLQHEGVTHQPYFFVLSQRDRNNSDPAVFLDDFGQPVLVETRTHSTYAGVGSTGALGTSWRYRCEAVYERGRSLSDARGRLGRGIDQTQEPVKAFALHAGLTYLFRDQRHSRWDVEFLRGSGDTDREDAHTTFGGNRRGSVDRSFNSLGFVYTGLALAPQIANLAALQSSFTFAPWANRRPALRRLRLGLDTFVFAKADPDAPMGFATKNQRWIGGEVDAILDWSVFSDLSINTRVGLFLPGGAMPDQGDDPRAFFLLGVTYAF